jgi:thiol-disulfide isomerase/thioredoxin
MRAKNLLLAVVMLLTACTAAAQPISPAAPIEPSSNAHQRQSESVQPAVPTLAQSNQENIALPTEPKAPPITNQVWLNTPPLTQADLNGKVVLVDFWTFGCINCTRTIPAVRELYNLYKDKGLIIVGVHSPEFDYEKNLQNVKEAVARLDVPYPVAIDNDFTTWRAFNNRYWPTLYLVDKRGVIRLDHIGELHQDTGGWQEMTAMIDTLLKE